MVDRIVGPGYLLLGTSLFVPIGKMALQSDAKSANQYVKQVREIARFEQSPVRVPFSLFLDAARESFRFCLLLVVFSSETLSGGVASRRAFYIAFVENDIFHCSDYLCQIAYSRAKA